MILRIFYYLCFLSILCFTTNASAAIYKKVKKDGTITFSNQPIEGGEKVDLNKYPVSTFSKTPPAKGEKKASTQQMDETVVDDKEKPADAPEEINPAEYYKKFEIASPKNEQTFQNQRKIPVLVTVNPDFLPGSKVQIYVDGTAYGEPAAKSTFTLNNLDRGSHTIYAELIDKNGALIQTTKTITIYVQYARVGPLSRYESSFLMLERPASIGG